MNQINLALSATEASLVLAALRAAADTMNAPQLDAVIDNLQAVYNDATNEDEGINYEDSFRTDAEADADALASAGYGTDEDYHQPEDAALDSYWESQTEIDDHYSMGE